MKSESESYNQYDKMYTSMKSTKSFPRIRRVVFSPWLRMLISWEEALMNRTQHPRIDWRQIGLNWLIVYRLLRTTFNLFVLDRNTRGILDVLIDAFATHSYHNNESRWMYIVLLLLKFTVSITIIVCIRWRNV